MPITGHVNPGLPIARALVARGHDVRWYSTARFKRAIEATGARWVGLRHALPIDEERIDEMWPDRPAEGIKQLQFDIKHVFIDFIPGALRDLEEELRRETADVLVGDNTAAVIEALHQRSGLPWALYGISALAMTSKDTAPFGLGILPKPTAMGRLRNKFLYWLVDNVIFRDSNQYNRKLRRSLKLPAMGGTLFDFARKADLYLQGTVPSFEYPRTDLSENVHFIGATVPRPPADWKEPAWWPELANRRVVLVTQGTINNDYDQLIRPAIRALAEENVFVVVTTGTKAASEVGIDPLPSNVVVERFIPYAHLMPHVDLLLTNGGYGTVQIALAHGVPVIAIGNTEEKPEIANRIEWSGVGVGLKVRVPSERQIQDAVTRVLMTPTYAARAEAIRYELANLDAAAAGAELLEELAGDETELERSA